MAAITAIIVLNSMVLRKLYTNRFLHGTMNATCLKLVSCYTTWKLWSALTVNHCVVNPIIFRRIMKITAFINMFTSEYTIFHFDKHFSRASGQWPTKTYRSNHTVRTWLYHPCQHNKLSHSPFLIVLRNASRWGATIPNWSLELCNRCVRRRWRTSADTSASPPSWGLLMSAQTTKKKHVVQSIVFFWKAWQLPPTFSIFVTKKIHDL